MSGRRHSSRHFPEHHEKRHAGHERERSPLHCTVLHVSNLPYDWTWMNLKDLFADRIGDVAHADVFDGDNLGTGVVEFYTPEALERAFHEMRSFSINGQKLYVNKEYTSDYKRLLKKSRPEPRNNDYCEEKIDSSPKQKPNYYGLNKTFLEALNIKPPIPNKAFVLNLSYKVTKEKLREIFSMAGQIHHIEMLINPDGTSKGMAVIEFDHPVEVVQAISMFNKQVLYERPMVVQVDKMSEKREFRLPDGLEGIGRGLGPQGSALRNVAYSVEKQMEQRYKEMDNLKEDQPFVTPHINMVPNQIIWRSSGTELSNQQMSMQPIMNVSNAVPINAMAVNNVAMNQMSNNQVPVNSMPINNMAMGSMQMGMGMNVQDNQMLSQGMSLGSQQSQGYGNNAMGDGAANMNAQTMTMLLNLQNQMQQQGLSINDIPKVLASLNTHGHGAADNYSKSDKSRRRSIEKRSGGDRETSHSRPSDRRKHPSTELLTLKNLPPGMTPKYLHEKLESVGPVKFVEMTGPFSALVSYLNVWDAEEAIKRFNGKRLEGYIIDVNYF